MIIGSGMLAKALYYFDSNPNVIIIASGVSNSMETRSSEFERELSLVQHCVTVNPDRLIVYFSTSSMYDPVLKDSPYVKHKLAIEEFIKQTCNKYYIFRVSQIIGRANNQTIINFLIDNILQDKQFDLWCYSTRNLIALNDVFAIVRYLIESNLHLNSIINVANSRNISTIELLKIVEKSAKKNAKCNFLETGQPFGVIDISKISPFLATIGINFNDKNYYINSINELLNVNL